MSFDEPALHAALSSAQDLGFLGDRPIPEAVEHSRAVVAALDEVVGSVADLGAGGGLPGLVLAHDRPDLSLALIDRRAKRTDFLERIVRRHGLRDRVEVIAADVEQVASEIAAARRPAFDAAVARGFGPPDVTLQFLSSVTRAGGRLVVTEPPHGDRWDPGFLERCGVLRRSGPAGVAVFVRGADLG